MKTERLRGHLLESEPEGDMACQDFVSIVLR